MDFKSLGWKFLTKETFGDGKLMQIILKCIFLFDYPFFPIK